MSIKRPIDTYSRIPISPVVLFPDAAIQALGRPKCFSIWRTTSTPISPRRSLGTSLARALIATCGVGDKTYDSKPYVGCLLFDDPGFCAFIGDLLQTHIDKSIEEIGSLDSSHTL